MTRRTRVVATFVAFSLLAAACSGDSDGSGQPDDPSDTAAGPTTSGPVVTVPERVVSGADSIEIDTTPIGVDPATRTGQLENGLTYYLRSNDSPGSQLQLRLVVRAGAVNEEEPLSGLAHFVEHMMFNGTEAFPKNTLNDVLRGFGSEFGADLNAYTTHDETVYLLSVPRTDDDAVEAAFDILDEWAERALITEQDTVEERGVVREEFRTRAEAVDGVILDTFDEIYTIDSDYIDRAPIGSEEAIVATEAEDLRRFYDRWYRPDLMAVVAVGDLPLERMEQEVLDRFADNEGRGDDRAWTAGQGGILGDEVVEVLTHPDGPEPFVSLDYSLPNWPAGTIGGERRLLMDEIVAALIQQRLDDGAARGTLPIVRPSVANFDYTRARRFLGFNFVADDEAAGLTSVIAELRAIGEVGFGDAELERVIDGFRAAVDQMVETAGSRQDSEYASDFVEHYLGGFAIDSVEAAHSRLHAVLDSVDSDTISEHYRAALAGSAPLVVVVGADAGELPMRDELAAAIDAAATVETSGSGDAGSAELPVPPDAVDEVERVEVADLDAVELRFANGARVLARRSEIAAGQVDLLAESSGGWSLLGPGDAPFAALAARAVALSGVGDLDSVDLDRALSGVVVSVSPYIEQTTEGFFGNSATDDVETLFQLLHLLVTEPRIDAGPFAEAIEGASSQIRAAETSPEFASLVALLDARFGGNPYQQLLPDADRLDGFTDDAALELYRERLGSVDDLVVAVAGDVELAVIEDLARRYIGSLPAGDDDTWADRSPPAPPGVTTREVGAGTNDSGAGFDLLMTAELSLSPEGRAAVPVLQNVINDLLVEQLREALGASYNGGQVFLEVEDEPDAAVTLVLTVSGDPARIDEMHGIVLDVLAELSANGPSVEDFESARNVVVSDLEFVNNFGLMQELLDHATDAESALTLADTYFTTRELTRADVTQVARELIDVDQRIEVFRRP